MGCEALRPFQRLAYIVWRAGKRNARLRVGLKTGLNRSGRTPKRDHFKEKNGEWKWEKCVVVNRR